MSEQIASELQKLHNIAVDMDLSGDLRNNAIKSIGSIGTHDALLTLLDLVANEKLNTDEREFALKQAKNIVKASR